MKDLDIFTSNLRAREPVEFTLTVTRELAHTMLQRNKNNRETTKANLEGLAREIVSGDMAEIADGAAFDRNGILVDGQQRLMAIMATGIPVKMRVMFGLHPDTRAAIDSRQRTSDSELLELAGYTHGDLRAAVIRLYNVYYLGAEKRRLSFPAVQALARALAPELDFLARYYPELVRLGVRAPLFCALAIGLKKDREQTAAFIERLVSRKRDGESDPAVKFDILTRPKKGRTREELLLAGLRCIRANWDKEAMERVRPNKDEMEHFKDKSNKKLGQAAG